MYYYRNVLVVTDNVIQYERFARLVRDRRINGVRFTYRHSPDPSAIHNHPDFFNQSKVVVIKEEADRLIGQYDLIFSIHCFQLFPEKLVRSVKCINVHPGYNPINRGWYPQVFAILHKLEIGATIHEMDAELDNGPVIDRVKVPYNKWDTSLDIYNRVLLAEMALLSENLENILSNTYTTTLPGGPGNLFLKKDFRALCQLDPEESGTMGDLIDRLRALTHGEYKNAWFIDPATGKKIFVKIELSPE